jgi:hypothetical protein
MNERFGVSRIFPIPLSDSRYWLLLPRDSGTQHVGIRSGARQSVPLRVIAKAPQGTDVFGSVDPTRRRKQRVRHTSPDASAHAWTKANGISFEPSS